MFTSRSEIRFRPILPASELDSDLNHKDYWYTVASAVVLYGLILGNAAILIGML